MMPETAICPIMSDVFANLKTECRDRESLDINPQDKSDDGDRAQAYVLIDVLVQCRQARAGAARKKACFVSHRSAIAPLKGAAA